MIVLGLAVSLARFVRGTAAERITRGLLNRTRDALETAPSSRGPVASSVVPTAGAGEAAWAAYARGTGPVVRKLLGGEADTDAWGTPLCYLPRATPDAGMGPGDRPFCFSAGPDGLYLTRDDNLYRYDELPASSADPPAATTRSVR